MRAVLLENLPAIYSLQLAQLREAGSHRQRAPRKRPRLIHRPERRELIHDFGASTECAHWQAAANHFSQCRQVGTNSKNFLRASPGHAETGHHFVENEKGAMFVALGAEFLQKFLTG